MAPLTWSEIEGNSSRWQELLEHIQAALPDDTPFVLVLALPKSGKAKTSTNAHCKACARIMLSMAMVNLPEDLDDPETPH